MTAGALTLPALESKAGFREYIRTIRRFPILEPEEEYMLAKRWREHGDTDAAHKLVTSHLRLVTKIAAGYRGYGLPLADLISEGNLGLMHAVKRFDPERGFRLATYAMWWIRANIQQFILQSWSLVKLSSTAAQKKLFFNLRRLKSKIQEADDQALSPEQVREISTRLDVPEADVVMMEGRMAGPDHSLNAPLRGETETEWQDWLVDESESQESAIAEAQELDVRRDMLTEAMGSLKPREHHILTERRLRETPRTLDDLSREYGISRERVRQIENRAFEKVEAAIRARLVESA